MKTLLFFIVYATLHIVVIIGIIIAWLGIIEPLFLNIFLIALGVLILINVIFGLYFLIFKSPRKSDRYRYYSNKYHKLKIEEADKHEESKK